MTYLINEIFYSIQGEGYWSGRPAVFVRFSNCNLWSGREQDRTTSICTFCDTTFTEVAYTFHTSEALAKVVEVEFPEANMVILTGGEPALQVDVALVRAFHEAGFYVAIETNGTLPITANIDWVCVSPKTPTIRIEGADELKLVYPQRRIRPEMFADLDVPHFWLSPMDGPNLQANTKAAYDYCLANPQWRLNTQLHKTIGVR